MRLIDADKLIEKFTKLESSTLEHIAELNKSDDQDAREMLTMMSGVLNERTACKFDIVDAPTVDAVPVIRCKDCKHAEREDDGDIMCTFWDFCECNHHVLENGYCDRAERRKDDRRQNNTV